MNVLNPLDWLLVVLLVYSVARAAWRGLFREALALAGLVVGLLLASWFYLPAAQHLAGLVNSAPFAQFLAFLLILAATMIAANLIGSLLRRSASAVGLGFLDRLGGAAFGLVRGFLLGAALLLAVTAFLPTAPWARTSRLAPYFLRAAHAVSFVMPSDLRLRFFDGLQHLKHNPTDWIKRGLSSQNDF